jgi:hypothetical protein
LGHCRKSEVRFLCKHRMTLVKKEGAHFFNEEMAPQRFDRDRVLFRPLTNFGAL